MVLFVKNTIYQIEQCAILFLFILLCLGFGFVIIFAGKLKPRKGYFQYQLKF